MASMFDYVKFDEIHAKVQKSFRAPVEELEDLIKNVLVNSREKSLALTKLEETWMWIGKCLKIAQETKNSNAQENK